MNSSKSKKQAANHRQSPGVSKAQPTSRNDSAALERSENAPLSSAAETGAPKTEVPAQAKRRRFTASYKLQILQEVDRASHSGEIGAILRREGLYSSHLAKWRKLRERGALNALHGKKRGPKTAKENPLQKELNNLEKENRRLTKRLVRAEKLIELQKKVAALLDETLPTTERDGSA